ncbi:hypothetical protein T11_5208 [Trichinella zimbabwensis]|uniref:Uncharacterized protein n=1 Tax=Trichinella zimbabwensis TaxID=268475 RepID=A0A0V1GNT7_9BILA|nr:hypothetical protein T11_5344 [Trichinella zimbabwensis]KRY99860.1 hypothetical protein T11_5208 [Trichinella zimbabwensis]
MELQLSGEKHGSFDQTAASLIMLLRNQADSLITVR